MSSSPLSTQMQALITYANETTGEADTDLSAAVGHLVDGYGGGSGNAENLNDFSAVTKNGYLNNGTVRTYSGWDVTDYMHIKPGSYIISFLPGSSTLSTTYCAKYTVEDKAYIGTPATSSGTAFGSRFSADAEVLLRISSTESTIDNMYVIRLSDEILFDVI